MNTGFVVEVLLVLGGVGWFVGIGNACIRVAVVLEAVVVDCGRATGLGKKLGTVEPVVVVEGSDFVAGAGEIVMVGLAKKFGTAGWEGTGTVFEDVGVGAGTAKRFFGGSLIPVAVASVGGFDCVEAKEAGVDKVGIGALAVEVVVVGVGEGFFSCSEAFFVSWSFCLIFDIASASISCFSHFENDLTCFNRGESKPTAAGL